MGRAHHIASREGHRGWSAAQGRPQFLLFSLQANAPSIGSVSVSSAPRGGNDPFPVSASPSIVHATQEERSLHQVPDVNVGQADPDMISSSGSSVTNVSRSLTSNSRTSAGQTTPAGQDRAGPSDLQSFSESLKSRLNAVSMRYRDSITKSTRGWKERLFSRNASVADIGSEVRREVSASIATVSRMMEHLNTSRATASGSGQQSYGGYSVTQSNNESHGEYYYYSSK